MFVSSHLMSEMALTADHLIVIGRGRLIADTERRGVRAHVPRGERRPRPLAAGDTARELVLGPDVSVDSADGRAARGRPG